MRNTWMTLSMLLIAAALIIPVGVIVAADQAGTVKQDGGEDAELWSAITSALQTYSSDRNDENLQAIADAIEAFMASEPTNEQQVGRAAQWYGQVKGLQGDLEGLAKRLGEWKENAQGLGLVVITYELGMANAKLGNSDEAEAAVEELRELADSLEGQPGQAAGQLATRLNTELRFVPGAEAPDFTLQDLHGDGEISLSDFRGKYVLIDFWASWCGPCHRTMANDLQPMYEEHGNDVVEILSVGINSRDTMERQKAFVDQHGYEWPKVFDTDGTVASEWGITSIPALFLIDAEGKIVLARDTRGVIARANEILSEAGDDSADGE